MECIGSGCVGTDAGIGWRPLLARAAKGQVVIPRIDADGNLRSSFAGKGMPGGTRESCKQSTTYIFHLYIFGSTTFVILLLFFNATVLNTERVTLWNTSMKE